MSSNLSTRYQALPAKASPSMGNAMGILAQTLSSNRPMYAGEENSHFFQLLPSRSLATKNLQKGMLLRYKKEVPQAIEVLEKAYQGFLQQKNSLGQICSLIELGWLSGSINERSQAHRYFQMAEELVENNHDAPGVQEARARLVHYRGLLLYHKGEFGQALKRFTQALTFCSPHGLETAKIYDSLGIHYERTGNFHRAVQYLKNALFIKTMLKEPLYEEAITAQILGRLYLQYEEHDQAKAHLQRALEITRTLKDQKREASIKIELIRTFLRCSQFQEAEDLIVETKQDCQQRHLKVQFALTCFYESYLHFCHQNIIAADETLQKKVLPVFLKFNYSKGLALAKRLQAWLAFAQQPDEPHNPLALMGEAIELFSRERMIDEVAKTHFELGKLYYRSNSPKLALTSFLDALKIAEENGLFYLTPFIEDEIYRNNEARWMDIVNKRARHERVFEKQQSMFEALSQLLDHPEPENLKSLPKKDRETISSLSQNGSNTRFLLSLLKVGEAIAGERDLDKLLDVVKTETETALDAERCTVFLYDEESNELWSRAASGLEATEEIRIPAHQGIAGYVVKTGQLQNVENAYDDPRFNPSVDRQTGYKTNSLLCLPVKNRNGHIIGVFQVLNKNNMPFQRSDEELLTAIASSAGIAIENAQLYREQKITFESFITALSSTIDARDPITAGHSERVTEYALLIGERMMLPAPEMEALKYAGLLHDIGKIGVREEVLMKEGRLTWKEYDHIQQHVYYTYEILKNIHFEKHLRDIPEIASSHHEKMDGTGYFRGTRGDDIPLGGRILSVADVFDAITSRRQYRSRMPFEKVIKLLQDERDKHFDGTVLEAFFEVSLHELSSILCMDQRLNIDAKELDRLLSNIPKELSVLEYTQVIGGTKLTARQRNIQNCFDKLYNLAEICDLD